MSEAKEKATTAGAKSAEEKEEEVEKQSEPVEEEAKEESGEKPSENTETTKGDEGKTGDDEKEIEKEVDGEKEAKEEGEEEKNDEDKEEDEEDDREKVAFKNGDWYCQGCGVHNFAKRSQCMSCGHMKLSLPASGIPSGSATHTGKDALEWECPSCQSVNPSRRVNCRHCLFNPMLAKQFMTHPLQYTRGGQAASSQHVQYPQMPSFGPSGGYGAPRSMYPSPPGDYRTTPYSNMGLMSSMGSGMGLPTYSGYGGFGGSMGADYYTNFDYYSQVGRGPYDAMAEWDCWVCGHLNHAKRVRCKTCDTDKDKALPRSGGGTPRPGDWFCMACQNVNFSKRQECKMCAAPRTTSSNEIVLQRLRGYAM